MQKGFFVTFLGSLIVLEKLKDFVCNISVWGTKCVCSNVSSGVRYLWLASMCEGFIAQLWIIKKSRRFLERVLVLYLCYHVLVQTCNIFKSVLCQDIQVFKSKQCYVLSFLFFLNSKLTTQRRKCHLIVTLTTLPAYLIFAIYYGNCIE